MDEFATPVEIEHGYAVVPAEEPLRDLIAAVAQRAARAVAESR